MTQAHKQPNYHNMHIHAHVHIHIRYIRTHSHVHNKTHPWQKSVTHILTFTFTLTHTHVHTHTHTLTHSHTLPHSLTPSLTHSLTRRILWLERDIAVIWVARAGDDGLLHLRVLAPQHSSSLCLVLAALGLKRVELLCWGINGRDQRSVHVLSVCEWVSEWVSDNYCVCVCVWVSEWVYEVMDECVRWWISEWVSEWVSE